MTRAPAPMRVNAERIAARLDRLAEIGKLPDGGVSRPAYSDADRVARALVMEWMREAGLEVAIDPAANLVGRRAGMRADLAPLLAGSHIDSVPEGGHFDGTVGSIAAIEVAARLAEEGAALAHAFEVVIFQNEEGGLVGSRALSGELPERELQRVAHSGKTIRQGIELLGGDPDRYHAAHRERGEVAAYLELHIEQGGVLEDEGVEIGVVAGIVGIQCWNLTVLGAANHAGTTPMEQRKDALLAAARFIDAVNRVVTSVPGRQVGTVGRIAAFPGAPNEIAGRVQMSLELRDLEATKIAMLFEHVSAEAGRIGAATGTTFEFEEASVNVPAPTDPAIREMIAATAHALGLSAMTMPSGAGHDAQNLARIAPVGMIFIPSVGGISHSPREFSRPADIVNGTNVLLNVVRELDRSTR